MPLVEPQQCISPAPVPEGLAGGAGTKRAPSAPWWRSPGRGGPPAAGGQMPVRIGTSRSAASVVASIAAWTCAAAAKRCGDAVWRNGIGQHIGHDPVAVASAAQRSSASRAASGITPGQPVGQPVQRDRKPCAHGVAVKGRHRVGGPAQLILLSRQRIGPGQVARATARCARQIPARNFRKESQIGAIAGQGNQTLGPAGKKAPRIGQMRRGTLGTPPIIEGRAAVSRSSFHGPTGHLAWVRLLLCRSRSRPASSRSHLRWCRRPAAGHGAARHGADGAAGPDRRIDMQDKDQNDRYRRQRMDQRRPAAHRGSREVGEILARSPRRCRSAR